MHGEKQNSGGIQMEGTMKKTMKKTEYDLDYLILVNQLHPLPAGWIQKLRTVKAVNHAGQMTETEVNAYQAFCRLRDALEPMGIRIEIDSAYRSIETQQAIAESFQAKYGADYTARYVAEPGCSEHHTGLALDVYPIVDGNDITCNDELFQCTGIWEVIHPMLAEYGFILRYPPGKEHITGYSYEPWHFRYIQDRLCARFITEQGLTLEEYLRGEKAAEPLIDLGTSSLFRENERKELADLIRCRFARWRGCELRSLVCCAEETDPGALLSRINSRNSCKNGTGYVKAMEFMMAFHTDETCMEPFEPDRDYSGCRWLLGCVRSGSWTIVSVSF